MERTLFGRIGALAARRPWFVIAFWVALVVALGAFAGRLPGRLGAGGFEIPGSQSLAVQRALEQRFDQTSNATAMVVVHHPTLAVTDAPYVQAIEALSAVVERVEGVGQVTHVMRGGSPLMVSPDRHTTYIVVALRGS